MFKIDSIRRMVDRLERQIENVDWVNGIVKSRFPVPIAELHTDYFENLKESEIIDKYIESAKMDTIPNIISGIKSVNKEAEKTSSILEEENSEKISQHINKINSLSTEININIIILKEGLEKAITDLEKEIEQLKNK